VDISLHTQASSVLLALMRAQLLFGGGRLPSEAPAFVLRADLEDNLGGGQF
jgi:hypothetical protein